jgi:hypothetical protein
MTEDTPNPDRMLAHITRILIDEHPGQCAEWFAQGAEAFLAGRVSSLDGALGLRTRGRTGSRQARRKQETKRQILDQAYRMTPGATRWERVCSLSGHIGKLDRIRTPTTFDRMLMDAQAIGPLPRTPEGLSRLISY